MLPDDFKEQSKRGVNLVIDFLQKTITTAVKTPFYMIGKTDSIIRKTLEEDKRTLEDMTGGVRNG